MDNIFKYNLQHQGIVSFVGDAEKEYDWQYHDGSKIFVDDVHKIGQAQIGMVAPTRYFDGMIDIVTETDVITDCFVVTEKTTRPIWCLKPFLTVACPQYHEFLHDQMGIKPYDEIFDYSFDHVADLDTRVEMIVANVHRLKDQNIASVYNKILPKLIENKTALDSYVKTVNFAAMISEIRSHELCACDIDIDILQTLEVLAHRADCLQIQNTL